VRHHAVHDLPPGAKCWSQELLAARRGISSHTTHAARRKALIMSNISRRTISRIGAEIGRIGRRLNHRRTNASTSSVTKWSVRVTA